MRLDKYLADAGIGTRNEVKKHIRRGQVTVDGALIRDPGYHVSADSRIAFQGAPVTQDLIAWFMLHKPAGIITAREDRKERTVLDLITEPLPEKLRRELFPVGRLDRDTEGLLLITNDGQTAHRLLSPKHHVDKVYLARVSGVVTETEIAAFREGIRLSDGRICLPAELRILAAPIPETVDLQETVDIQETVGEAMPASEVEITIREGKYHQIKRMFRSCGHEVLYLKRIAMGPLYLDETLPAGAFQRLTEQEILTLNENIH